jgi:non-heme chloroperoxidase
MHHLRPTILAVFLAASPAFAQQAAPWRDPSPHKVQFITVDKDLKPEVLDWGGSGRPVVLLGGLGATAHVFDDFSVKLTSQYHVYGITRRGYGESSVPMSGYSADRLGDDVVAVLDALKLEKPVLVGHSLAGEEMSSVATRHYDRIAGLVYLEAGYPYAYYDSSRQNDPISGYVDWDELKKKAEQALAPNSQPATQQKLIEDLLKSSLPSFEKALQQLDRNLTASSPVIPPPKETAADD